MEDELSTVPCEIAIYWLMGGLATHLVVILVAKKVGLGGGGS